MKKVLYILAMFIFFHLQVSGQVPPWTETYPNSQFVLKISFDSLPGLKINTTPLSPADYIGAFYQSDGKEICLGFKKVDKPPVQIFAKGDQAADSAGRTVYFKIWKKDQNCIVENFSEINTGWNLRFKAMDSVVIKALIGRTIHEIVYPKAAYCFNDDQLVEPVFKPQKFAANFSFSQGFRGNQIGQFVPSNNVAGQYLVTISNSTYCLNNNTQLLTIEDGDSCKTPIPPADSSNHWIFAPFSSDPAYHAIEINRTGKIRIYNHTGRIVRHLEGPALWDGTDDNGQPLPTEEYFVQFEDGEQKKLTIIR